MTMITPSYLGETIEYSSLHACRSTLEDPTGLRPAKLHEIAQRQAGPELFDVKSFDFSTILFCDRVFRPEWQITDFGEFSFG